MSEILLSICIPTYSRPKELRRCLLHIIERSRDIQEKIEILVIDDAPHHPAQAEIDDLRKKHSFLKYLLNKKNIGLDKNFVQLMKKSRGKYLVFLTDDDVFTSSAIEDLLTAIISGPQVSVIAGGRNIERNGMLLRVERQFVKNTHLPNTEYKNLGKILYEVNILSGLCLRKQDIDYRDHEKYYGSLFAHLHIVGLTILQQGAYYIARPLVDHQVENEVFWQYSADFYLREKIHLAENLMKYSPQLGFWLRAEFLKSAAYMMYSLLLKPRKFFSFINSLVKQKYYRFEYLHFILMGFPELLTKKLSHSKK